MFGMNRKPRGLFGGQMTLPGPIGGYGGGTWNVDGTQATPVQHHYAQEDAAPQRKGGVFGSGVPWGDALYALGGALAGDGGAAVQQIKQARLAPLMEQMKREQEWADWQRREQWKLENAPPKVNDTERDFAWYKGLSDEDRKIYHKMRPQYRQGPDGRFYAIEVGDEAPDTLPADFDFGGPQVPPAATFPRR